MSDDRRQGSNRATRLLAFPCGVLLLVALCAACSGGTSPSMPDDAAAGGEIVGETSTPSPDTGGDTGPPAPCTCDDNVLCTTDDCADDGSCVHEPLDRTGDDVLYRKAPTFTLADVNPESAGSGQNVALADLRGKVVVLLFHSAACPSCIAQGQLARTWYEGVAADTDVYVAAVNDLDGAGKVGDYVNAADAALGAPAPPNRWAFLQDTADADVWGDYCADTDQVFVIDIDGLVQYSRVLDFADAGFAAELNTWIASSKASVSD